MAAADGTALGSATIATLRDEDAVDGVFACTRKERLISRAGTSYLSLELRDSSGTIRARAFREADMLAASFERGELVRVTGRATRFRDELQIDVATIATAAAADADPASFLPTARRDLDELEGFYEHLAREVYDAHLAALLRAILGDQALRAELRRAPCSLPGSRSGGAHHAYLGGLLEHTVAVATLAVDLCALHARLDRDLLLTAALVHDLGRTREFAYGAEVTRTREGSMLGHIELGLRVIAAHAPPRLDEQRRLALEHCVMMHHGAADGPAARFVSHEALALYRLNALDASLKGAFESSAAADVPI
jgi:3'-5' exoribonuclease